MKRLTAPWTSALATAALLALPAVGGAQTPQTQPTPPEPQPQQSTTLSTPSQQNTSAAEHLRLAKEALAALDVSTIPARAKSQMTELRRHITALEQSTDNASATGAARRSPGASKNRPSASWANDVAAIDRIITQLAGDATTSGATEPGAVGTTGSKPKESAAVTLDENTRTKLLEVRKHITEFAASMSGTASQQSPSATSQPQPTPSAAAETAAAAGQTPTQSSTTGTGQTSSSAGQSTASTTGTTGQATSSPAGTTGQTSPTGTAGQTPSPTGAPQTEATPATSPDVNADAARQHLTAARNSLTQLTQLPAAAQLQGDARTQVSQLIQNFNELITTQTDWRTAYDKVEANLTALIGPAPQKSSSATPSPDPAASPAPTPTPEPAPANPPTAPATPTNPQAQAGTPGTPGAQGTQGTQAPEAVGTSGTATIDPGVRQKLTEFREHLLKFHDAAGGAAK